jgi:hypothetical protein
MARKKAAADTGRSNGEGDSIASYFRAFFEAHPRLLWGRSNKAVLQKWRDDHPDEEDVPDRIKNILANTKSLLRKKKRKKGGRRKADEAGMAMTEVLLLEPAVEEVAVSPVQQALEQLEDQIDDCLTLAKSLGREEMADVIGLLKRARNRVVWKSGE